MSDYDCIIIGSGIGGSALGAILAKNGLKVLLLEKNKLIGGRCSTYEKDGFKIDVGVHGFCRSFKGPLGRVLEMIGMEKKIEWVPCRRPGQRFFHQGKFLKFPNDFKEIFPKSDFVDLMKLLSEALKIKDTSELDTISVELWLSKYSESSLLKRYLNYIATSYFVLPYYEASAGEFIKCLSTISRDMSIGYPKGGCISIPKAYTQAIEEFGGSLRIETAVKKIITEDGCVEGVELETGEIISSKYVVSNAGIKETVNDLVGRKCFGKEYLKELDLLKYSMSALTLKIALKKPITNFKLVGYVTSEDPETRFDSILKGKVPKEVELFIPIPSNFDPQLAPEGKQLIIAGTAVSAQNFEKNQKKWVENSIESLEYIFPELPNNLLWFDISTPNDIELFGGKEASVIGISQNTDQVGVNRPSSALPIEGLFVVGGDAGGWGIGTELAAQSAIECSEVILKQHRQT